MAIKAQLIQRRFNYNGMVIHDPNPNASLEDVVKVLSATYPEMTSAKMDPSTTIRADDGSQIHTFNVKVATGSKG
jgi:PRTRC genetic system protein C